jgi:hypothetical protein
MSPVLLPTYVPPPGIVNDLHGSYDGFDLNYRANRLVYLGTLTTYPAAYQPKVPPRKIKFRSDPAAVYMVQDPVAPGTTRFITWKEPGHSADKACSCVSYTLLAEGLSEDVFLRVANSLG